MNILISLTHRPPENFLKKVQMIAIGAPARLLTTLQQKNNVVEKSGRES
jgi:hypothetical protein